MRFISRSVTLHLRRRIPMESPEKHASSTLPAQGAPLSEQYLAGPDPETLSFIGMQNGPAAPAQPVYAPPSAATQPQGLYQPSVVLGGNQPPRRRLWKAY